MRFLGAQGARQPALEKQVQISGAVRTVSRDIGDDDLRPDNTALVVRLRLAACGAKGEQTGEREIGV